MRVIFEICALLIIPQSIPSVSGPFTLVDKLSNKVTSDNLYIHPYIRSSDDRPLLSYQIRAQASSFHGGVVLRRKTAIVLLLVLILISSGAFTFRPHQKDDGSEEVEPPSEQIKYPYPDVRHFVVMDPDTYKALGMKPWAVFNRSYGGNCCEHYLATTHHGWITNLGGEYPTWSEDEGVSWQDYRPVTAPFLGPGEGAIIEAPDGSLLAMSWYPYSGDEFYAYYRNVASGRWEYRYNRLHAPFYDRPWIAAVPGPIITPLATYPWASLVTSNLWNDSVVSLDGLTYMPLPDPSTAIETEVFDLDFSPDPIFDFLMPHREMRAMPLPDGGLLLPRYFGDEDAYLRPDLTWARHRSASGSPLPSSYVYLDSSGALHALRQDGLNIVYKLSTDGGRSWTSQIFTWPNASRIEEWEFKANGMVGLAVLYMRVQIGDVDKDILFHIRSYRQSIEPDTVTLVGLGDLDATSGAGNEVRFDFASLAILPDGAVVVSFADSTDEDPLFALELEVET